MVGDHVIFVELNLKNTKILINCFHNPRKSEIKKHLTALRNSLDFHSSKYEKFLILGDFSVEIKEANMKSFCEDYNLENLIKQPTCYKSPNKPTCIDLILTHVPHTFQSTCVLKTGLWFSSNDSDSYEEKFQENASYSNKL